MVGYYTQYTDLAAYLTSVEEILNEKDMKKPDNIGANR